MFKISAFRLEASVKTSSPLLDCRVNHGRSLVKFVPCRHNACVPCRRNSPTSLIRCWWTFLASPTRLCSSLNSSPDCSVAAKDLVIFYLYGLYFYGGRSVGGMKSVCCLGFQQLDCLTSPMQRIILRHADTVVTRQRSHNESHF